MAVVNLITLIKNLRQKIEEDFHEVQQLFERVGHFRSLDEFIASPIYTDLEKAFYLILNQFPYDKKNYIVIPREMVLIPDVYDMSGPGIEYEIDFALYGGSIDNPVKVAIECDGLRSHRQKHNNKDRRKDINLQAHGWIVMRFGSKEIHDELQNFLKDKSYVCRFLYSIESVIEERLRLIITHRNNFEEYRSKLTGYKWGNVKCIHCDNTQIGRLNHKKQTCFKCGQKFIRTIDPTEGIKYEYNGLIYYNN